MSIYIILYKLCNATWHDNITLVLFDWLDFWQCLQAFSFQFNINENRHKWLKELLVTNSTISPFNFVQTNKMNDVMQCVVCMMNIDIFMYNIWKINKYFPNIFSEKNKFPFITKAFCIICVYVYMYERNKKEKKNKQQQQLNGTTKESRKGSIFWSNLLLEDRFMSRP